MITLFIILFVLMLLFGVAFQLTGALLKACLWLFVLLPVGIVLGCVGIALCCTIILIPVGIALIKAAVHVIIPV